jgi:ubiquinone/menaquinone biosynthesis C-methylase UbiE
VQFDEMSERSWKPTDYDAMARIYDAGRATPQEWVHEWRSALSEYLTGIKLPVADVGSGTGIWAKLIADWFDTDVVGIEPSTGMRTRAARTRSHPRVHYIGGHAEHLPLRDKSCSAIWMSTVVHHFGDLNAAAREARRVLQDGGPVLVRQAFSGRHDGIIWTRFFPSALRLAEARHPTVEAVVQAFTDAGFTHHEIDRVTEIAAVDLHHYKKKVATRADSTLELISDEEFHRGLEELSRTAADSEPEPVTATLDLLVLT